MSTSIIGKNRFRLEHDDLEIVKTMASKEELNEMEKKELAAVLEKIPDFADYVIKDGLFKEVSLKGVVGEAVGNYDDEIYGEIIHLELLPGSMKKDAVVYTPKTNLIKVFMLEELAGIEKTKDKDNYC